MWMRVRVRVRARARRSVCRRAEEQQGPERVRHRWEPARAHRVRVSEPDLALAWGASCWSADRDYAIYEGQLGDFASHTPVRCTTGDDFHYAGRVVRVPFDGELLVVVDRGTVELAGRVTAEDDGSPVDRAEVTVSGDTARHSPPSRCVFTVALTTLGTVK